MQLGLALLEKIGLFAHKAQHVDPQFDQRLQRIGAREMAREAKTGQLSAAAVRNPPAHRAI